MQFNDNQLKQLITTASNFKRPSKNTRMRILTMIKQNTQSAPQKKTFLSIFKYRPVFSFSAAALVLISLIALVTLLLIIPVKSEQPLVVASQNAGILVSTEQSLTLGQELKQDDTIRNGAGKQTIVERKDMLVAYLFSESELKIAQLNKYDRALQLKLRRGSLYINKLSAPDKAKSFKVDVGADYTFILTGTRVYFSIDENRKITVILYDGSITIDAYIKVKPDFPFVLNAPITLTIFPDARWEKQNSDAWTEQEKHLDTILSQPHPYTGKIKEISLIKDKSIAQKAEETTSRRYQISRIGNIAPARTKQGAVNYYASVSEGGRGYFINQNELFILDKNFSSLRKIIQLSGILKAKPIVVQNVLCLSSANSLILIDTGTFQISREISLPADGSIDHNYFPQKQGSAVYVPVQNWGYYKFNPLEKGSNLILVYKEVFPLAPAPLGNTVFVGSYYNNYVGLLDRQGTVLFKSPLNSNCFVNYVIDNEMLYVYSEENAKNKIICFNTSGKRINEWELPWKLVSDFKLINKKLCCISTTGRLFMLNTTTGAVKQMIRLYHTALTTRQMRYFEFLQDGRRILAGTEDGQLVIIDALQEKVVECLTINKNEKFFAAPLVLKNNIYCIANSGNVYSITKNEK
jgi:hypothetical protein